METTWQGSTLNIKFPTIILPVLKKPSFKPVFRAKVNGKVVPLKKHKQSKKPTQKTKYKTFQIIPHASVKNNKADQFPDILADTFKEIIERFQKGGLHNPDRVFFETNITSKAYQTFITTNDDLSDLIKQQAQMTWKDVTIQDTKQVTPSNHENTTAFNIKLKYPFFMSLKTDKTMQQIPLEEILEISRFIKGNDQVFMQFGFQAAEDYWYKDADKKREEFEKKPPKRWGKKDFHKSTNMKPSNYGFDFVLRFTVYSKDERRRNQIARGLNMSLKQLNQDNELVDKKVNPKSMKKFMTDMKNYHIKVPYFFGKRQILTPPEIMHFIKLPQRALQDEYPIIETVTGRETGIPEVLKKGGIELGVATYKGKKQTIYMPTGNHDELCLPNIAVGGMGSGKTKGFGANWIVESVNNGFGALAIDPAKGEIGDEVQSALSPDQITRIKLGKVPISLDWCEVEHSSKARNRLANTIIGFFNTATDEAGAQTARYIRASVMAMQTGKLSEIIRIFEDDDYRKGIIEQMQDGIHKSTLVDFSNMSDGKKSQILAPIMNRLDTILGDEYLAECMESNDSIDMVELMSERKAFIIDVPKSELGMEAVDLIINLLSTKIDLAMTLREEKNQHPFFVIFDEPHQYLRSTKIWKSAVVESRKWRLGYVWLFHSFEQIPRDLAEIIKSAGIHYHIYPSSKKTFTELKEEIAPFTVEESLKLKKYHAINIIRAGETGVLNPVIAKMLAPPSKRKSIAS